MEAWTKFAAIEGGDFSNGEPASVFRLSVLEPEREKFCGSRAYLGAVCFSLVDSMTFFSYANLHPIMTSLPLKSNWRLH